MTEDFDLDDKAMAAVESHRDRASRNLHSLGIQLTKRGVPMHHALSVILAEAITTAASAYFAGHIANGTEPTKEIWMAACGFVFDDEVKVYGMAIAMRQFNDITGGGS